VGSRILYAPAAHVIPDYPGRSGQMTRCLSTARDPSCQRAAL